MHYTAKKDHTCFASRRGHGRAPSPLAGEGGPHGGPGEGSNHERRWPPEPASPPHSNPLPPGERGRRSGAANIGKAFNAQRPNGSPARASSPSHPAATAAAGR